MAGLVLSHEPHLILDGRDPLDAAGNFDRFVPGKEGTDEAAQLNRTSGSFNADLFCAQGGFIENRLLYPGRDDGIVNRFSRLFLPWCRHVGLRQFV